MSEVQYLEVRSWNAAFGTFEGASAIGPAWDCSPGKDAKGSLKERTDKAQRPIFTRTCQAIEKDPHVKGNASLRKCTATQLKKIFKNVTDEKQPLPSYAMHF